MNTIKHLFVLIIMTLLLSSCSMIVNKERVFDQLKLPIVVVAESTKGAVTVCDSKGNYVTLPQGHYLAQTISASYNKGDTLRFLEEKETK